MQDFYLIVNWLVTIALLTLGVVTVLKNRNLTLNRVFALFTVTVGIWIIASYISNDVTNSPRVSVIGNYFVFLFSYISGYLLLWFAVALARDAKAANRLRRLTIPILLIGAINCTPLVVAGAKRQGSVYAVEFGPLAVLYFLSLVILLVGAMVILHKNIKRTDGHQKANLKVLYRCMAVALPILLLTEFVLPAITGWFGLTNVGIIAMAIPVVGLYYGVVKFKLFELRFLVVRSLGYVITLGVLLLYYGVFSYYATTLLQNLNNAFLSDGLKVVLLVVIAVTYAPLKRIFDKLTNSLFYRDAYDPQSLFDRLNQMLVSTLDLDKLLNQIAFLLAQELKAQFCLVGLKEVAGRAQRVIGTEHRDIKFEDIMAIRKLTVRYHQSVIATDYLEDKAHKELKRLLTRNDVAVLVRLAPNVARSEEGLGYLALGPKKSGNPYTSQDFRVLDTIANELIIAIQNALHFEEIQNFNKTLQGKVVEATKELRRTNDKLKTLDETKDDFISMASHQLRTPLTSVKGYLSMVLDGDAGKLTAMEHKMLTQAFVSSQRMVYLISDLLNVSRLKTGKFVIERTPVNLSDMINDEIAQLKEAAATRSLSLQYDKPKAFPLVALDETKTRQVIMNFIDNAIYYTPGGGHIHIELEELSSSVELRVVDDGIGVPKSEQHHLFTKFYRAGNARKARPDGTGLGLFMARKVVIAQGGAIIFKSAEHKGSTFGFSFPKTTTEAK